MNNTDILLPENYAQSVDYVSFCQDLNAGAFENFESALNYCINEYVNNEK